MKIIAFGHKKRVGKDTAAKFLMSVFRAKQINCQRLSFGDQIKSIAHRMFGHLGLEDASYYFNHPESIEQILPAIGKSPRQIWDDLGVMGRKIWPYTWSSLALKDMDCDIAICSDFRTKEDYQALAQFDCRFYRIDRDSAPVGDPRVDDDLPPGFVWDGIINNNGSLRDLMDQITRISNELSS